MQKKRVRLFPILFCTFMVLCSALGDFSSLSPYTTTVKAQTQNVQLSKKNKKIAKGQMCKIKVNHLSKGQQVVFQIDNTKIVSIVSQNNTQKNSYCKIKGASIGKTKLYATIYQNHKKITRLKCNITVTMPAVSVRFRTSSVTLKISENYNLLSILNLKPKYTAEIPVFTVSDHSILSVKKTGVVTGLSEGTVSVTATIASGKSDTITITVKNKSS